MKLLYSQHTSSVQNEIMYILNFNKICISIFKAQFKEFDWTKMWKQIFTGVAQINK